MTADRRRTLAALAALVAVLALGVAVWRVIAPPLSATEHAFVGAWEMRHDPPGFAKRRVVWEFRPDRTCTCRHFDRATGAESGDAGDAVMRWRLRGSRLVIVYPDVPLACRPWELLGPRLLAETLDLTPDGSGGYRFAETMNDRANPTPLPGALIRAGLGESP